MVKFLIALVAATLLAVDSTPLLRSDLQGQDNQYNSNGSERLLQDSTCTLYRQCVTYPPSDNHPSGHHEDSWVCKLLDDDNIRSIGADYVDIIETSAISATLEDAVSGESTITFSKAIVDADAPRMFLPENSIIQARKIPGDEHQRLSDLTAPAVGTLSVLVIRVIDTNGKEPTPTGNELRSKIFGDGITFKTQMNDCSFNKFRVKPFTGKSPNKKVNIINGIVNIKVDKQVSLVDFPVHARTAAKKELGNLDDPKISLVLYCFPEGMTDKGLAWAYPRSKYSFYQSKWCSSVGAIMHEVGHNIGLGHSGEDFPGDEKYGDGTGVMGTNAGRDPVRVCYNAQKSYQLGWYKDQTDTLYPVTSAKSVFTLNAVPDYGKNKEALVVLRLEQKSIDQDYYIGFNRPVGKTVDILEDENMVTIILKEKGNPNEYSQSLKMASLLPGQRHVITNFDGKRPVQIRFIGLRNGNAIIEVLNNADATPPISNNCDIFTIEFTTDAHPEKNSWYIVQNSNWGRAVAASPEYTQAKTQHIHKVCLPLGFSKQDYNFTVLDEKQRNTCSYKIYKGEVRSEDQLIFSGDKTDAFETRTHLLEVPPSEMCEDDKYFLHQGVQNRGCDWIATKPPKYCNIKPRIDGGKKPIFIYCPATCSRCADDSGGSICRDDPGFRYKKSKARGCNWIKKKVTRNPQICNRKVSRRKRVHHFCKIACGKCE